jgi:hypothetical protein
MAGAGRSHIDDKLQESGLVVFLVGGYHVEDNTVSGQRGNPVDVT